jgi:hypothetical protein
MVALRFAGALAAARGFAVGSASLFFALTPPVPRWRVMEGGNLCD